MGGDGTEDNGTVTINVLTDGKQDSNCSMDSPKAPKPDPTARQAEIAFACTLNVTSSVCVIFANKFVFGGRMGFHFGTALTICHFIFSFFVCGALGKLGVFEFKRLQISSVLPICYAFSGYVVFNNLSLLYNSVCIYQLAKIACTPAIVMIEKLYYKKKKSKGVIMALYPTCLGVCIAVYSDPQINAVGLLWAGLAIVANSLYTIWGQTKQRELGVEPMQLLLYQAPLSAVLLCVAMPFFDDVPALVKYQWNSERIIMVLLTCILGFGVNFSFFLGVGKTSPLTMNLLGHLKTVLVFVGGVILFGDSLTVQKLFGGALTIMGLVMYGNAKVAEAQKK